MPGSVSAGMAEKKASNAAKPPADAPMPTTGKAAFERTVEPALNEVHAGVTDGRTEIEGTFRFRLIPFFLATFMLRLFITLQSPAARSID